MWEYEIAKAYIKAVAGLFNTLVDLMSFCGAIIIGVLIMQAITGGQ